MAMDDQLTLYRQLADLVDSRTDGASDEDLSLVGLRFLHLDVGAYTPLDWILEPVPREDWPDMRLLFTDGDGLAFALWRLEESGPLVDAPVWRITVEGEADPVTPDFETFLRLLLHAGRGIADLDGTSEVEVLADRIRTHREGMDGGDREILDELRRGLGWEESGAEELARSMAEATRRHGDLDPAKVR